MHNTLARIEEIVTVYCILVLLFIVSEGHLDCDGTSTIHNTAIFVCFSIKYNYHLDCAGTFLHNSVHYSGNFCMFFY